MRAEKKYAVEEFKKNLEKNSCAILTNYTGSSAEQLNSVRADLEGKNSRFQVVKNKLFVLAVSGSGNQPISELLNGQVGVVYTNEDQSIDILKYLVKFKKDNDVLKLLGGILDGNVYNGKELETLSKLPNKEMMRARVAGAFKSPLSNFAQIMRSRLLSILYVINAIIEKRKESNEEPS